jgi:transcriptional regulator with PAS, ATPase and Fis domain
MPSANVPDCSSADAHSSSDSSPSNQESIALEAQVLDGSHSENMRRATSHYDTSKVTVVVGASPKMHRIYELIFQACHYSFPVLILGETGTGKELIARSLHALSPRKCKPFVPVDCAALTPTLIESELFGYARGAFTGAQVAKRGLFASAQDGTILLDEIGELPLSLQSKLLRVIQERKIRPVGALDCVPIKARIIAATSQDLPAQVKAGKFREDLFYRLNVVQISVPPLRERKDDILLLAETLIEKHRQGTNTPSLSADAIRYLIEYPWPGNVRELENTIQRALCFCSGPIIEKEDLAVTDTETIRVSNLPQNTTFHWRDLKREAIDRALSSARGDKQVAARLLGIGRTTLYRTLARDHKCASSGTSDAESVV